MCDAATNRASKRGHDPFVLYHCGRVSSGACVLLLRSITGADTASLQLLTRPIKSDSARVTATSPPPVAAAACRARAFGRSHRHVTARRSRSLSTLLCLSRRQRPPLRSDPSTVIQPSHTTAQVVVVGAGRGARTSGIKKTPPPVGRRGVAVLERLN
jgi:hypothetical protein